MQVYKKILVTVDCSPVDDVVIEHVSALALQNKAQVRLLHVVHSHSLGQDRAMRQLAEASLATHRALLEGRGIKVDTLIRSGEPEDEILAEIEQNDFDLVAMATHGHSFFGDLLFGSVSRTLKHKISTPLLLIGRQQ